MPISRDRLKSLFKNFNKSNILVIGDLILDQFIWGDVSRISPEAPVPVVHVQKESFMPGGAANVACAITKLKGNAGLAGIVGKDIWGKRLKRELPRNTQTKGIVIDAGRHTILKTRIVARHQQVVRVDKELHLEINKKVTKKIISYLNKNARLFNAIIIEDYGKGVVTPELIKAILKIARRKNIIVTVDPKEEHFSYYKGVHCITPNEHEAEIATGIKIKDAKSLNKAGAKLMKDLKLDAVLITRGENGMALFIKGKKFAHIPTRAQEVFDVSGAGDTVIGSFTLALASGASFIEAAHISNYAAGVVVGKLGTGTCTQSEVLEQVKADNAG